MSERKDYWWVFVVALTGGMEAEKALLALLLGVATVALHAHSGLAAFSAGIFWIAATFLCLKHSIQEKGRCHE